MTRNVLVRAGIVGLAAVVLLVPATAPAAELATAEFPCSAHMDSRMAGPGWTDDGIGLTSALLDADGRALPPGRYALPAASSPTQLVVMFHGHGNDSCSWRRHLLKAASLGAVAVAMDYSGPDLLPPDTSGVRASYGWYVKEAATHSIAAAKYFLGAYPTITKVIAFGISMGGNASGLAVAAGATRADGITPLFDYWIDVEGVNNLIEEYLVARAAADGLDNAGAALAVEEIEEENGGPLEAVPDAYLETTNVVRAPDMAGLDGAVVVVGSDDGLVPIDQSYQMTAALTLAGVPTHHYSVILRGDGEPGSTGTGIAAGPVLAAAGQEYNSPLAGHGWEGSDTHLVIQTGFNALYSMLSGASVVAATTIVHGT